MCPFMYLRCVAVLIAVICAHLLPVTGSDISWLGLQLQLLLLLLLPERPPPLSLYKTPRVASWQPLLFLLQSVSLKRQAQLRWLQLRHALCQLPTLDVAEWLVLDQAPRAALSTCNVDAWHLSHCL